MLQECRPIGALDVKKITPGELSAVLSLQEQCLSALPQDQDVVIAKKPDAFEQILTSPDSDMIGIWSGGDLVAQAIVQFPEIINGVEETLGLVPLADISQTSVMGGVLVSPQHQGQGLMGALVSSWKQHAQEAGKTQGVAMIVEHNVASMAGFLKAGLAIADITIDPYDGATVYMAQGATDTPCRMPFTGAVEIPQVICPKWSVEDRKAMFEDGFKGVSLLKSSCGLYTPEISMVQEM